MMRAANFVKRQGLELEEHALQQLEAAVACTPAEQLGSVMRDFFGKDPLGLRKTTSLGVPASKLTETVPATKATSATVSAKPSDSSAPSTSTKSVEPQTSGSKKEHKRWTVKMIAVPNPDVNKAERDEHGRRIWSCPYGCTKEKDKYAIWTSQEYVRAHIRKVHQLQALRCDRGEQCKAYDPSLKQAWETYNADVFVKHANQRCHCENYELVQYAMVDAGMVADINAQKFS